MLLWFMATSYKVINREKKARRKPKHQEILGACPNTHDTMHLCFHQ